jgi:cyclopropane fatty-acyl-phospholipid synthase-like methyltransferase
MMMPSLRNWFGRSGEDPAPKVVPEPGELAVDTGTAVILPSRRHIWAPERIAIVGMLWGEGFQFPGGEAETLRLAKPLGLSAASTLLLLGAGSGGPAKAVASKLGAWVSGFEADADLASAATDLIARTKLGRRSQIDTWDPTDPDFAVHYYHHALAFEPLRGNQPELILSAIAMALKPGGQFTMVEVVADTPLEPSDHDVAHWARMEHRRPDSLSSEIAITRVLGRLGFDVRIVEDISGRHIQQAMMGWRRMVRSMEAERLPMWQTALLVEEAELWLVRLKLFRAKQLRLVRWHAIGRGSP